MSKIRRRVGGCHYLRNKPDSDTLLNKQKNMNNIPIHVESSILKHAMGVVSKTYIAEAYVNARKGIEHRITRIEMNHMQHYTPLEIDNTIATGILIKQLVPRRSKVIDVKFHWLRDRENQKQFNMCWKPGKKNLADYFTKHHPEIHHRTQGQYISYRVVCT